MKILITIIISFMVVACANKNKQYNNKNNQDKLIEAHQENLDDLQQWQIKGKLSIISDSTSASGNVDWQQQDQNYKLYIVGPFGQGAVNINGNNEFLNIRTANGKSFKGDDPSTLTEKVVGVPIPVDMLSYWIKGSPSKFSAYKATYRNEKLSKLSQEGWSIEYQEYQSVKDIMLPKKIQATKDDIKLNIWVGNWL